MCAVVGSAPEDSRRDRLDVEDRLDHVDLIEIGAADELVEALGNPLEMLSTSSAVGWAHSGVRSQTSAKRKLASSNLSATWRAWAGAVPQSSSECWPP